ncbi:uncharacterized protein [Diabrotica undecimpunctata]|uniref:uncharacterized protein n=1 Tax=Diabrotica undecimpunctata TaxID=50387 RepID=UPI003B63B787
MKVSKFSVPINGKKSGKIITQLLKSPHLEDSVNSSIEFVEGDMENHCPLGFKEFQQKVSCSSTPGQSIMDSRYDNISEDSASEDEQVLKVSMSELNGSIEEGSALNATTDYDGIDKTTFTRGSNLQRHEVSSCYAACPIPRKRLRPIGVEVLENGVTKLTHAFKNRIASYRFMSKSNKISYSGFMNEVKPKVIKILSDYLLQHTALKVNCELFAMFYKPENEMSDIKSMNTSNKIFTLSSHISDMYDDFAEAIMTQASEFQEKDSNWALQEILFLDVNINKFSTVSASAYINLPSQIKRKGAILNIQNKDSMCFAYCVMAAIFPANGDPTKPESYPPCDTLLNFDGIGFPVKLKDINKFEILNNISVNVYGLQSYFKENKMQYEVVGPLHYTQQRKLIHVNLLLISDNNQSHYCLITDLYRLVKTQKTKYDGKQYFCDGCLQTFSTLEKLKNHQENDCLHISTILPTSELRVNKCGETLPSNILKFINIEKTSQHPFVIYADFESILKPIHHCDPSDGQSYTIKVAEHQPYSFCFYLKCFFDDSLSRLETYQGEDAAKVFVQKLDALAINLYQNHLKHIKPMVSLTREENKNFQNAIKCSICQKSFSSFDKRVQDHDHLTGLYRGAAHNSCNLNFKVPNFIPILFHNLTNYDCHMFIKELTTNGEYLSAIAQTKEKYITFSKSVLVHNSDDSKKHNVYLKLRFVDSFKFLAKSLDKLSQTLESSQCNEIRKYFPGEKEFGLMRRKGVFPYTYIDSYIKLEEKHLPSKEKFYDNLRGEHITTEDYNRAQEVWDHFNCQSMGDYGMLYLKSDVLLLADIFENFRKVCLKEYKLDPAHYVTAPSLTWDAMLKYTDIELQLLTDVDMVHFFKKGIRGGVATCTKRMGIANNRFLSNFDPTKPETYIMYLDATNLYGAAMSQPLPWGNFRWLNEQEIDQFNVFNIDDDGEKGYVLEVDLHYPPNMHDQHNDLPFCPESIVPPKSKYKKLIPNLYDKKKYVIHYRNLKQCIQYGLKLERVHRILEFSQSLWLKKYIDLNTFLRNNAKNEFERDLFKLLVNAIFGKSLEGIDKRKDIRLVSQWENSKGRVGAKSLIAKPEFNSLSIFSENLVAIHLNKTKIIYDKPLYIGFSILDVSKTFIYDFFYGYIKNKYHSNANLLYTDTDSLILEVQTPNFYDDMNKNLRYFDTSNYSENNQHGVDKTKSILGKMKNEFPNTTIKAFYGTGAKAYCIVADTIVKKAKGVSRHVVKNQLHLNDYVRVVQNKETIFRKMYFFRSEMHTVYTELRNKVSLTSRDDKRYVIPGDVSTLAWGHLLINQHEGNIDDLLFFANEMIDAPTLYDLNNIPNEELFQVAPFYYDSYL